MSYIQVLLINFLIISDYFFSIFSDFFRIFPIFSKKNFRHFIFFFFHFFQHFFTVQSFFNTIFTRALDLHLSLVVIKINRMVRCCVPGCKSDTENVLPNDQQATLHKFPFPNERNERKKWLQSI